MHERKSAQKTTREITTFQQQCVKLKQRKPPRPSHQHKGATNELFASSLVRLLLLGGGRAGAVQVVVDARQGGGVLLLLLLQSLLEQRVVLRQALVLRGEAAQQCTQTQAGGGAIHNVGELS